MITTNFRRDLASVRPLPILGIDSPRYADGNGSAQRAARRAVRAMALGCLRGVVHQGSSRRHGIEAGPTQQIEPADRLDSVLGLR